MEKSPCDNCNNLKPNAYWHRYTHHCIIKINGMNLRPCDMKNKKCPYQEKKIIMRNTSEANFPFLNPTNCYFTTNKEGFIVQRPHKGKYDRTMLAELADIAKTEEITIYAVWPGKWSSDLFIIDNLDDFKQAMTSI